MQNKIMFLSLLLFVLMIIISCTGLLTSEFYAAETINWQAQCIGQDMIDLFVITPCLLISAVMAYKKNNTGMMVWGGTVLYLTYTFVLYCFEVHFNKLFVFYCLGLGVSFYSLFYFLFTQFKTIKESVIESKIIFRVTGIYFIVIAILFYMLWLSEIIPAIIHYNIPKSVAEAGLFTNGVQVLDLSIILPAIFVTGILLLKKNAWGNPSCTGDPYVLLFDGHYHRVSGCGYVYEGN